MHANLDLFLAFELDAKVIHDEDKKDRTPLMAPQAGCDEALVVAIVVGEFPGLFQAVNAFVNLEIYPSVVGEGVEVVFIEKLLRYVGNFEADVFGSVEGCTQVEVGDVKAGKSPIRSRKNTVQ
jgi:hypothetical protein